MGSSNPLLPVLFVVLAYLVATYTDIGQSFFPSSDSPLEMSAESVTIDGLPFPNDIKIVGSKQSLIGGGTRSKWGFRVYAVGIYGDLKIVKNLKKKYGETETVSSSLSSDFSESKQAKTVLLRFHREVAASDVSDALGDALIEKIGDEKSKSFSEFILGMLGGDRVEKGTNLYITCKGDKLLASLQEGKEAETITIKGLCPAIFMVYLGDKPVSPQAKEGFEKGFADMVL